MTHPHFLFLVNRLFYFLPICQSPIFFIEYQSQTNQFFAASSVSISVVTGFYLIHCRFSSSVVRHFQLHYIDDFRSLYGEVYTTTCYLLFFFNVETADIEEVFDDEPKVLLKDKLLFF